ncbi:hypothetical protein QUC31_000715 [Theobroma cacao]
MNISPSHSMDAVISFFSHLWFLFSFAGMPLSLLGLGAGGGCGVGFGLGWGFGSAYGSQYRSSRVTFQGLEFGKEDRTKDGEFKVIPKSSKEIRESQ